MAYDAERHRRLLLALESAKHGDDRAQAGSELCELAAASEEGGRALFVADVPKLVGDAQVEVKRCGLALAATVLPPDEARTLLEAHLKDPAPGVRIEAAGRLADLVLPQTRAALAAALEDPVLAVRFEAARGMAALQHPSGREVLEEAMDKNEYRFRALGALGELGDPRALPAVRAVFKKWLLPSFERTQAAGVMAKLGDPEGARHLLKVASGRWSTDRALALELCGELKVPGAREELERAVKDPKDACRGAAARGLGRLGDARAMGALVALLEEASAPEDFRLDAGEGLVLLGTPEARARVETALGSFSPEAREELKELLAP